MPKQSVSEETENDNSYGCRIVLRLAENSQESKRSATSVKKNFPAIHSVRKTWSRTPKVFKIESKFYIKKHPDKSPNEN